jgi:translation initiation factor IF-3
MARTDLGRKLIQRVTTDVGERGVLESSPEMTGNRMHAILGPPRQKSSKKEGADSGS